MIDDIFILVHKAIADVETRLKHLPPGIRCLPNHKAEHLPAFYEDMLHFEADQFPDWLQQYIVAFSGVPIVCFGPNASRAEHRKFYISYEERPGFEVSLDAAYPNTLSLGKGKYFHDGLSKDAFKDYLALPDGELNLSFRIRWMREAYNDLLNFLRLNRFQVPSSFSSLQLYTFFTEAQLIQKDIRASARSMMEQIVMKVDQLEGSRRTKEEISNALSQLTGLPKTSVCVAGLISNWALPQRLGIFETESDRKLVEVFFEVLRNSGHMDAYHFNFAMEQACHQKGVSGITTPASVRKVMPRILGSYYHELLDPLREKNARAAPKTFKSKPMSPDKIRAADTTSADVRQIIEKETLGTGERDASSLNHSALYRHPKVPQALRNVVAKKREP